MIMLALVPLDTGGRQWRHRQRAVIRLPGEVILWADRHRSANLIDVSDVRLVMLSARQKQLFAILGCRRRDREHFMAWMASQN